MENYINLFDVCDGKYICTIRLDDEITKSEANKIISEVKANNPTSWTTEDVIEAIGAEIETDALYI